MNKPPSLDERVLAALGSETLSLAELDPKVKIGKLRLLQHLFEMTQRGLIAKVEDSVTRALPTKWRIS